MRIFGLLLLIGLASAAPETKEDDKMLITKDIFSDQQLVYTAKYDVVNIYVPLNALNFEDSDGDDINYKSNATLFFVQADIKEGVKDYKGLYSLKEKVATKLLENGRDIVATSGNSKEVYFGATDGLYTFDSENNKAVKYGSVTDSIIGLAKENGSDEIYILTENKELFKVTEDGNKKEKIDVVKNAEQIVLDDSNNLYYYSVDKKPYVFGVGGVTEIKGLPNNPTEVTLLRPPLFIDGGVPFIVDNKAYLIYANGTSELTNFKFQDKPSAYSMEGTLIQYYAYEKKIYEFNVMAIILGIGNLDELGNFLGDKKDDIRSIASQLRKGQHNEHNHKV